MASYKRIEFYSSVLGTTSMQEKGQQVGPIATYTILKSSIFITKEFFSLSDYVCKERILICEWSACVDPLETYSLLKNILTCMKWYLTHKFNKQCILLSAPSIQYIKFLLRFGCIWTFKSKSWIHSVNKIQIPRPDKSLKFGTINWLCTSPSSPSDHHVSQIWSAMEYGDF